MIENIIALAILVFICVGSICCSFGWNKTAKENADLKEENILLFKEYSKQRALAEFYENELTNLKDETKEK